jgi:hypothetical protein
MNSLLSQTQVSFDVAAVAGFQFVGSGLRIPVSGRRARFENVVVRKIGGSRRS